MRHRRDDKRLGKDSSHRTAMMSALACALIKDKRIRTTAPKAKAARRLAEKLVTTAREGTPAAKRRVESVLKREECVNELFATVVPAMKDRKGGYTRIMKLGPRRSDGAEMAFLEWVDVTIPDRKKKSKAQPTVTEKTDDKA